MQGSYLSAGNVARQCRTSYNEQLDSQYMSADIIMKRKPMDITRISHEIRDTYKDILW
jgi:hypothetical protein